MSVARGRRRFCVNVRFDRVDRFEVYSQEGVRHRRCMLGLYYFWQLFAAALTVSELLTFEIFYLENIGHGHGHLCNGAIRW